MLNKKVKILVFPCGSEIGLEINNALKFSKDVELYGASSDDSSYGEFVYNRCISGLPYIGEDGFLDALNKHISENKIDFVFPAHDEVVYFLSKNKENLKCGLITSDFATCNICRHKAMTYEFFDGKVKVPTVFNEKVENFPVFLKPNKGQGSRGVFVANNQRDLDFYRQKDSSLITIEYLPGKEYTVDCFTDRRGVLHFCGARERKRILNGISINTVPVNDGEFLKIAEILNENLSFRGVWFFQLKRDENDELTLMEIAPRVSGSSGLFRARGVNLPLLSVYDVLDMDVSVVENKFDIEMRRALTSKCKLDFVFKTVYVDFDDTLIVDDKVNYELLAFLYKCKGANKRVRLLTRKNLDVLKKSLDKYQIFEFFDEIICIDSNEAKSTFIEKGCAAIFIDDSFSERFDVSNVCKIPVFDLDVVNFLDV